MLRLSSFLNLSFNHRLKLSDDQYTFGYSLFYELAELEIEKPYNNNLFKGVRDLTNNAKTFIHSTDKGRKKAAKFVTDWLIPSLQPLTFNDFLSCIVSLIENDETISDKNKNDLLKLFCK